MKIVVTIANYGTKNDSYLYRLLAEYRAMPYDIDIVVLTNVPKTLGAGVEVVLKAPRGNPWSFPFAHKQLLAERLSQYDLFIYSEDDTLITRHNIDAFQWATTILPCNEIAGFIRSEVGHDGDVNFSTIHGHFHWDPNSVVSRGCDTFAFLTNEHSAAYMLTRRHLEQALHSGGFLVAPHQDKYDLLVTAATDPYTQCGFRKMISISRLNAFVLQHLTNRYIGEMGIPASELTPQLVALQDISNNMRPRTVLMNCTTALPQSKWSKPYYEPVDNDILSLVPTKAHSVLSYGCGWGKLEARLADRGLSVTAIPLDSVIGACAEARGVKTLYGESDAALGFLSGQVFDCILICNLLHLTLEPKRLLTSLSHLLSDGGILIATVPHLSALSVLRRLGNLPNTLLPLSYSNIGAHLTSPPSLRRWFTHTGFTVRQIVARPQRQRGRVPTVLGRFVDKIAADDYLVIASRTQ